jgi:hypothetical protein
MLRKCQPNWLLTILVMSDVKFLQHEKNLTPFDNAAKL